VLAALVVIVAGVSIEKINHPFDAFHLLRTSPFGAQFIYLNHPAINIGLPFGYNFIFSPWSAAIIFIWLMIMMYSTKLLDGLDGLVGGLTGFGSLILASFCLFSVFYQPSVALIGLILAGASFGFLFFNRHPAKIFLGEGGSLFCGFMLGLLAIIAGGKLALAFMIVGLAVIDLFWTIFRRICLEHRSPFSADRGHLHFRLISLLGYKQTVYLYWLISILLGTAMFFLRTKGKIIAIASFLIIVLICLFRLENNSSTRNDHSAA
jgi:UDP-GlcNAc:undecaprenyl-phosphate GlcNAc-1-phosphate transferase